MRVLIIGGGGREHALAWALAKDDAVSAVYAAPGNPGSARCAILKNIPARDVEGLVKFARQERIDLTIVGPEVPLSIGLVDAFQANGLRVFGPTRDAARIEWSKTFAKLLCDSSRVPVPAWQSFEDPSAAKAALSQFRPPWVVKADGLAAGKGVIVADTRADAERAIDRLFNIPPGRVLLEQFVDGWELTITATVAGEEVCWTGPPFQDSKQVGDGDSGANTGGMGVFTPVPGVTDELERRIAETIVKPIALGLARGGTPFYGLLSPNLMVERSTGVPYLLECNSRFGDPETQALVPFITGGLAQHFFAIADGMCGPAPLLARGGDLAASVNLVVAAAGYPERPQLGSVLTFREPSNPNIIVFHAGTAHSPTGDVVTAGGRVLNIVATGPTVSVARALAYDFAETSVHFAGKYFRSDIGELGCSTPRPTRRMHVGG